jgi:hypothetical protein
MAEVPMKDKVCFHRHAEGMQAYMPVAMFRACLVYCWAGVCILVLQALGILQAFQLLVRRFI